MLNNATVEHAVVNDCQAVFIVPTRDTPESGFGLLLSCLGADTLFQRFPDWVAVWAEAGYLIASYDFLDHRYTWGADGAIVTLDALYTQARAGWPVKPRPAICGSSRGGLTGLVWAHRHRGLPIGWFGMNPVMELRTFYDQPGRAAQLNAAHGVSSKDELVHDVCPRANPVQLAPDLSWLPMCTWQGREDRVTPPEDLALFEAAVRAVGGTHTTVLGPGGHATAEGPRYQFDAPAQLAFVREHESVGGDSA